MKKQLFLMSAIAAAAMMTACSSTEDAQSPTTETTGAKTLVLKIGAGATTRTVGADPTAEDGIQNVVVGVFNSDGAVDNISSPTVSSGSVSVTYKKAYPHVIVVANAPLATFSGAKTKDAFIADAVELGLTTATGYTPGADAKTAGTFTYTLPATSPSNATEQSATCLPMVGDLEITASNASNATVNLYRLVSRISVASITTSFDDAGVYKNATFTPTEIFVAGVPSTSTVKSPWAADWTKAAPALSSTLFAGNRGGSAGSEDLTDTQTGYLTTGSTAIFDGATFKKCYFYVFPGGTYTKATDFTGKLRVYIKGDFDIDGSGATASETVYYPIVIGRIQDGTTITSAGGTKTLTAADVDETGAGIYGGTKGNQTYTLNVTIKSKGVTDLKSDIAPTALDLTLSVQPWSKNLTQDVDF